VSSYGIPLSTHPTNVNLLSIVSVHRVLIAQQISYLIVRLSDEKRLREEVDRLHGSLQQTWKERQRARIRDHSSEPPSPRAARRLRFSRTFFRLSASARSR
jgi:hypothetical protein